MNYFRLQRYDDYSKPTIPKTCYFNQEIVSSHWFTITFEYIGKRLRLDDDWAAHKLWDIITPHELTVVVRIGTGQFERLGADAFLVDMGEERTGIGAIVAAAAEYNPSAVARPGVVALCVGRVELLERVGIAVTIL